MFNNKKNVKKYKPPSLSELTSYEIYLELTHLGSKASKYNTNCQYKKGHTNVKILCCYLYNIKSFRILNYITFLIKKKIINNLIIYNRENPIE